MVERDCGQWVRFGTVGVGDKWADETVAKSDCGQGVPESYSNDPVTSKFKQFLRLAGVEMSYFVSKIGHLFPRFYSIIYRYFNQNPKIG